MLSGYQYYRDDVIDHTKIDADLTDFPVTFFLSSSNFDFSHVRSDMNDVRFTDTSDNLYKQEGELRDQANSKAVFHIKVSSISSAADTTIRNQYDNPDETSNGDDAANVWDSNFKMVQHMNGSSYSGIVDSTSNNVDATGDHGTPDYNSVGQVGDGVHFVHADAEYITLTDSAAIQVDKITLEFWIKLNTSTNYNAPFCRMSGNYGYTYLCNDASKGYAPRFIIGDGSSSYSVFGNTGLNDNTWHYLISTYDRTLASANGKVFVDLSLDGSLDETAQIAYNSMTPYIGTDAYDPAGRAFDGDIDEIRISDIVRSDDWLKATYNSTNDTLLTYGAEESALVAISKIILSDDMQRNFLLGISEMDSDIRKFLEGISEFPYMLRNFVDRIGIFSQTLWNFVSRIGAPVMFIRSFLTKITSLDNFIRKFFEKTTTIVFHIRKFLEKVGSIVIYIRTLIEQIMSYVFSQDGLKNALKVLNKGLKVRFRVKHR